MLGRDIECPWEGFFPDEIEYIKKVKPKLLATVKGTPQQQCFSLFQTWVKFVEDMMFYFCDATASIGEIY